MAKHPSGCMCMGCYRRLMSKNPGMGSRRTSSGRVRNTALQAGAAAISVTGNMAGAGTPPDTSALDDARQIDQTRIEAAPTDATRDKGILGRIADRMGL